MTRVFIFSQKTGKPEAWIERTGRLKRKPLKPRDDLWPFTKDYACGDTSSGTHRLALAILCEALGVEQLAMHLAEDFTKRVLAYADSQYCIVREDMVVSWAFESLEDELFPGMHYSITSTEKTSV